MRHFSTVEYSSSESDGMYNVRQRVLAEFQIAREVSVDVSYTCSSSVNQGLEVTLGIALLDCTGYRDTAFPGIRFRFGPKFSRDSMNARSRGATYPRDGAFPF